MRVLQYELLCIFSFISVACTFSGSTSNSCPLGFVEDQSKPGNCICAVPSGYPFGGSIHCIHNNVYYSNLIYERCVTLDNDNTSQLVAGFCGQIYTNFSDPVFWPSNGSFSLTLPTDPLELEDMMCSGSHRSGTLCAQCNNDTAIDINSITMDCIPKSHCSDLSWLWLILEITLPLTLLFIVFVCFQPNLLSSEVYTVILLCQSFGAQPHIISTKVGIAKGFSGSLTWIADISTGLYGMWNLDIMRYLLPHLCTNQNMGRMQVLSLEYVTAFYPLLLILITYAYSEINARYFDGCFHSRQLLLAFAKLSPGIQRKKNPCAPTVKIFAAFLLLSYNKLVTVSMYLLLPQPLYNINGSVVRYVLFFDASVDHFSSAHLPYALFALAVLTVFNILPTLLLLLYPFSLFQRILESCHLNRHGLIAFVDVFQGCYKNRSNNRKDYRIFSGIYFVIYTTLCVLQCLQSSFLLFITLALILSAIMAAALILFKPFNVDSHNSINAAVFIYISGALSVYLYMKVIANWSTTEYPVWVIAIFLSSFWPAAYIVWIVIKSLKKKCCIRSRHQSYSLTDTYQEEAKPILVSLSYSDTEQNWFDHLPDRMIQPERSY